jgi:hypothetical protein
VARNFNHECQELIPLLSAQFFQGQKRQEKITWKKISNLQINFNANNREIPRTGHDLNTIMVGELREKSCQ